MRSVSQDRARCPVPTTTQDLAANDPKNADCRAARPRAKTDVGSGVEDFFQTFLLKPKLMR